MWAPLVKTLMTSAPRWSAAAASVAEIAAQYLDGTAATPDAHRASAGPLPVREARDTNAELAVDVDDLAVRPDLAADPEA